jgi:hypothetical protein
MPLRRTPGGEVRNIARWWMFFLPLSKFDAKSAMDLCDILREASMGSGGGRAPSREDEVAYTDRNFKSKKALKEAVAAGEQVTCFKPNDMFGDGSVKDGKVSLEGPHFPEPHRWYAQAVVSGGVVVSVK